MRVSKIKSKRKILVTIELYNFSQSTCSIKVRLLLEEKKLLWKDNRLVSANNDHLSEWYLKLNPNGVVPTLIHNGKSIYESTAILEYLEDTFPESCLRPTDPYLCSQVRAWLIFVDVWPAPAIRTPSFHFGGLLEKFKKMPDEKFNELKRRRPLKKEFYNSFDKNHGFTQGQLFESFSVLRRSFARMDFLLNEFGGPWLFGKSYTIGDIAILPTIDRALDLGLDQLWLRDFPSVQTWWELAINRQASQKAFYEGSRLSQQFPKLKLGSRANSKIVEKFLRENN